jgi:N-acylglucosamine 2-epimerase
MAEPDIQALLQTYRDGLLTDTLPFWIRHGVDAEHGGVLTCLDRDGTVVDSDKGVWQQGRFCWLLAELYNNVERRQEWLTIAESTGRFLQRHCFDPADGRMWFHVTRSGRPIRKRRYRFSESFAAIAFGELALATGKDEYRELAKATFQQFRRHFADPPELDRKFTAERRLKGIGFPMISIATAQQLRQSVGLDSANAIIDQCIDEIRTDFMKPAQQVVMESVLADGGISDHFDGRLLNPGHALEAAWFILLEAEYRGDAELLNTGCTILDWMWARGWDNEYGGLRYFADVRNLPVQEYWHDMKFWWPHNEAIIATLLAWILTGNPKYADWHAMVHKWAYQHFRDPQHGEWYGYLHRDGRLSVPLKGNLWKGPFHLPRMQYTCWQLLERHITGGQVADLLR